MTTRKSINNTCVITATRKSMNNTCVITATRKSMNNTCVITANRNSLSVDFGNLNIKNIFKNFPGVLKNGGGGGKK